MALLHPSRLFRVRPLVLLLGVLACAGHRSEPASAPAAASSAAAAAPAAVGRWYGYEGGLKDAEASARSVEGASQYWTPREGRWRSDSAAGTFTAYTDGKHVRRLVVTIDSLTRRRGTGAFTYDEQGRLYYFGGTWRTTTGRGKQARTTRTVVSVAMNGAGEVGAASQTVGGRRQALTSADVRWLLAVERAARGR